MRRVMVGALLLATSAAAPAQELPGQATLLDSVLRHIGDNDFRPQCGADKLRSIGLWGDQYTVTFSTSERARFQVRLDQVWGVQAGLGDAALVDGRTIGLLPPSQDFDSPGCGKPWASEPFELDRGPHVLTIRSGADDIAFHGVTLMADRPRVVTGHGKGRVSSAAAGSPKPPDWMEVLMDTTTMLATFGLLAFLTERLTNGIAIVLGYFKWWETRMEVSPLADPAKRTLVERNRRVALFGMSAVLAIAGAWWVQLDVLAKLGLANPSSAGPVVTGLLIASGADPIRELLKGREMRRDGSEPAAPIQITGTLVLQTPPTIAAVSGEDRPSAGGQRV